MSVENCLMVKIQGERIIALRWTGKNGGDRIGKGKERRLARPCEKPQIESGSIQSLSVRLSFFIFFTSEPRIMMEKDIYIRSVIQSLRLPN